jgi:hypothetical protein
MNLIVYFDRTGLNYLLIEENQIPDRNIEIGYIKGRSITRCLLTESNDIPYGCITMMPLNSDDIHKIYEKYGDL